jgi:hypothetical protein
MKLDDNATENGPAEPVHDLKRQKAAIASGITRNQNSFENVEDEAWKQNIR